MKEQIRAVEILTELILQVQLGAEQSSWGVAS